MPKFMVTKLAIGERTFEVEAKDYNEARAIFLEEDIEVPPVSVKWMNLRSWIEDRSDGSYLMEPAECVYAEQLPDGHRLVETRIGSCIRVDVVPDS